VTEPSRDRSGDPGAGLPSLAGEPGTAEELAAEWEADKPPAAGPLSNLAAAVVVIALGVFGAIQSLRMGTGAAASPGAGTWPFLVSLLLIVLGVALAVSARRMSDAEQFSSASWAVLLGLATMVGFGLLIPMIGFEIPGVLLAFAWLKVLGRESWRTSIIASLAIVAAFYLIFVVALGTSIPHLF
jgi:putative tricarboxylic transport membrane protein